MKKWKLIKRQTLTCNDSDLDVMRNYVQELFVFEGKDGKKVIQILLVDDSSYPVESVTLDENFNLIQDESLENLITDYIHNFIGETGNFPTVN
jgi:hypothetical protein